MKYSENSGLLNETECTQCGKQFAYPASYLRRDSFDPTKCSDCKAKPVLKVKYGNDYCEPWHGHYDLEDRPIKDGELYRPGVRKCGHSDCIRPSHIIGQEHLLRNRKYA